MENHYQNRFGRSSVPPKQVYRGYEDDMEREDYFGTPRTPSSARMPNTAPRPGTNQRSTTTQSYGTTSYRTQQTMRRTTASVDQYGRPYDQPTVVSANQKLAETEKVGVQKKQGKKRGVTRRDAVILCSAAVALGLTGLIVDECYVQPAIKHWHEGDNQATVTNLGDKVVVGMVVKGNLIIVVMDSDGSNAQQFMQTGVLYDKNPHEVEIAEQDVNHDGRRDLLITVDNLPGPVLYNTANGYQWKDPTKK